MDSYLFLLLLCTVYGTKKADGSYLDAPRIHFAGQFRADVNTRNNNPCNFDPDNPLSDYDEWNYQGTNEWELVDTVVTSIINENGEEVSDSSLLGAKVFSNINRPFAKIVDIDVDFQVSSLYGLEFGLSHNNENVFVGKWSTSVIVHDMWVKMKCNNDVTVNSLFGAQSTTKITDILWSKSELIDGFKAATKRQGATGDLSVSINLDVYKIDVFIIGRIYGTIGVAMANEPLNVGGERKMYPADPGLLNFPSDHPCYGFNEEDQKPWSYGAPFKVDSTRNVLIADLGNALPSQLNHNPLDLGTLYFGILVDGVIQPLGEAIPYTDINSPLWKHSGIIEQSIESDIVSVLESSKLVVFIDSTTTTGDNKYPIKETFPSMQSNEMVSLILLESDYFIRPLDYYMDRLEYSSGNEMRSVKNTTEFTLLVTQFGQPVSNAKVTVIDSYNQAGQPVLPLNAVAPLEAIKTTASNGHVTFTFAVVQPIPKTRSYVNDPCSDYIEAQNVQKVGKFTPVRRAANTKLLNKADIQSEHTLPVDGNLYNFYYCVGESCTLPDDPFFLFRALISILAFSTVTYEEPYTWVDHVQPIFRQVCHLHYIMRTILDLGNYTEVILLHNIEMLKMVFLKPECDPNYMPTTRDLSPTKKQMILAWLDDPKYSNDESKPDDSAPVCDTSSLPPKIRRPDISHFRPPRCLLKSISFNTNSKSQDMYFLKIIKDKGFAQLRSDAWHPPRALFGLGFDQENITVFNNLKENGYIPTCTLTALHEQLQNAVLLEFSTLPLYLTSMYSIVDNCNNEAYQAMRDIVMQEMLHFVEVANILIAVGGQVIIDDPDYVPSYPSTGGLPGGVLPGLDVSLEKFNLRHVYSTMMAIESPMLTYVARPDPEFTLYTISQLYKEISLCIRILGDDIFDASSVDRQVQWPWTSPVGVGIVHNITDGESAREAITQIIEQGEGEGLLNPNLVATGQYGHFYRFEEIVCQRRLIETEENGYAYAGAPIPYDSAGVYPMRDNPSSDTIVEDSDCYTQAKAFHNTYRSFLRVLHKTFNGEPDKIHQAVELMEVLQIHAKRCMWIPYGEGNTCGPVWNYEWKTGGNN